MKIYNEYFELFSKTQRVSRSYRPDLLDLFRYGKKVLGLKCYIDFRIGDFWDAWGLTIFKTRENPHTVLIPNHTLDLLNREELLYIIGHELGHIDLHELPLPELNESAKEIISAPDTGTPEVTAMAIHTHTELIADSKGVLVAGGVEHAISASKKFFKSCELGEDIENIRNVVAGKLILQEIILMKALKLMDKTEAYYDELGLPLFKTGKKLLSEEDSFRKIMDLFEEWPDCHEDQYAAMTESADAAYYVLLQGGAGGISVLPEDAVKFRYYDYKPKNLSRFTSVEEAYLKISESGPALSSMKHPLKYLTFGNLVCTAFETESDLYVAEEFVRDTGRSFGFSPDEIRQYLNQHQHRFEIKKAG